MNIFVTLHFIISLIASKKQSNFWKPHNRYKNNSVVFFGERVGMH